MYEVKNLFENDDVRIVDKKSNMSIVEYMTDLSVDITTAQTVYFANRMNVRKRQLAIQLDGDEYTLSAGAMQWMVGNVEAVADVKGVGDFLGKTIKAYFIMIWHYS